MNNFEKNITFVIVSFRSAHIIENCIKSINPDIKIIIVENSNNLHVKNYLENKFLNVEVIIANENLGYGKGNNLGISRVNTQYAFILNPDAILEKNCLDELSKAQFLLEDDFVILAPNLLNNYGYFLNKNNNLNKMSFDKIELQRKSGERLDMDLIYLALQMELVWGILNVWMFFGGIMLSIFYRPDVPKSKWLFYQCP